jgi:hypothetical protein
VFAARHLAVSIIRGFPSRIGQSLKLVAFGKLYEPKVGIRVSTRRVEVELKYLQAPFEPILKMEFFVIAPFAFDELARPHCLNAHAENG